MASRDPDRRVRSAGTFVRVSTDFQSGREALGTRVRELRAEAGLNGKEFAARLGWQPSKVSRLQAGKQTPTHADLEAWATAADRTDALPELKGRLNGLETTYRSWRRQAAAGHRARQEQAAGFVRLGRRWGRTPNGPRSSGACTPSSRTPPLRRWKAVNMAASQKDPGKDCRSSACYARPHALAPVRRCRVPAGR